MQRAEYNDLLDSLTRLASDPASVLPDASRAGFTAAAEAFDEERRREQASQAAEDARLRAIMKQVDSWVPYAPTMEDR